MSDVDTGLRVPRLAKGPHGRHSGKMCAMNLLSWERGDFLITDYPACTAAAVARFCQHLNDRVCTHGEVDSDLLCAACSMGVIDVAHATVGTGDAPAVLSWRWAAAVSDLAADELRFEFPSVAADRVRTAESCRDIARQLAETPRSAVSTHTESLAAGQSASSALGTVMACSGPARTIEFAARAVAVWHELAASVPRVVDSAVSAGAWAAAGQSRMVAFTSPVPVFLASPAATWAPPVWLPSVAALSGVSPMTLTM